MAIVKITNFGGLLPALSARSLPLENATTATNLLARVSEFRPILDGTTYSGVLSVSNPATIYRLARSSGGALNTAFTQGWKAYASWTNLVQGQINDNLTSRTYVTDGAGAYAPRVIDNAGADRQLGVPAPSTPTVTLNQGDYFTQEDRDESLRAAKAQILAALRGAATRYKVGATFTANATDGILEDGAITDAPPTHRFRVHRYTGFEGTISDAYGSTVEADVAWIRATRLGGWAQSTGTPSWMGTAGTWHYALAYPAYGVGFSFDQDAAEAALGGVSSGGTGGSYTMEVTPYGSDPYAANNSLYLRCDGANNSTTFTDSSANAVTVTPQGNAKISTGWAAASNGAAAYFDGSGDYLEVADNALFELAGEDFCMRCSIYLTGYSSNNGGVYSTTLICKDSFTQGRAFALTIDGTVNSYTTLAFVGFSDNTNYTAASVSYNFALNTKYDVAVARQGNYIYLFVNGALLNEGGTPFSRTIQNTAGSLKIGARVYGDGVYFYYLTGYMDEIQITKGASRLESTAALLTSEQAVEIAQNAAEAFDPDGVFANPVVQALRDKVTAFEALINTRPPGSNSSSATTTANTAAITAAANAIYDRLARNASTQVVGAGGA